LHQEHTLHILGLHAYHAGFGTPEVMGDACITSQNTSACLVVQDILAPTTQLSGTIIATTGCHAGLSFSDPIIDVPYEDLPQAYAGQQAHLIASTGYSYGNKDDQVILRSDRFIEILQQALLRESSVPIGNALVRTKKQYAAETGKDDRYATKVVQEMTLYGLPMYTLENPQTLGNDEPFPGVDVSSFTPPDAPLDDGTVITRSLRIGVQGSLPTKIHVSAEGGYTQQQTDWGSYYALDQHMWSQAMTPIQPLFYTTLPSPLNIPIRSVMLKSGTVITLSQDPVIDVPIKLGIGEDRSPDVEPTFVSDGYFPAVPFAVQQTGMISDEQMLLTMVMGQYDSASATQRVFEEATFGVNYSSSDDYTPPYVESVDGYVDATTGRSALKVTAQDPGGSGIQQVVVCLLRGNLITCEDLRYDRFRYKWMKEFSDLPANTQYSLQVVDNAGNLTYSTPKGGTLYVLAEQTISSPKPFFPTVQVALPLVLNQVADH
jgi:hypothetical protein